MKPRFRSNWYLKCSFITVQFNFRYNSETGTFTVPPGGDGYYSWTLYLIGANGENSEYNIEMNGERLCSVRMDQQQTSSDVEQSTCSAIAYAAQGTHHSRLVPV